MTSVEFLINLATSTTAVTGSCLSCSCVYPFGTTNLRPFLFICHMTGQLKVYVLYSMQCNAISFCCTFLLGPFKYYVSIRSGWVGSAKCLCYMLNRCPLLVKFAYKVGGWVKKWSKICLRYLKDPLSIFKKFKIKT